MIQSLLRVEQLRLRNFRCFAEGVIDLHPTLTVLVAENGRGKTAILDALGIALGYIVDQLSGVTQYSRIEKDEIRRVGALDVPTMVVAPEARISAHGLLQGQSEQWWLNRKQTSPRTTLSGQSNENVITTLQTLRNEACDEVHHIDERDVSLLPLVASYGTNRLWNIHSNIVQKRMNQIIPHSRSVGYRGCLDASASVDELTVWYAAKMEEIRDPRSRSTSNTAIQLVYAVEEATRVVLAPTQWNSLDWDSSRRTLLVNHPTHGHMPLSVLSSGVRTMLALVMDVARRCALLNPHLSEQAAHETPGVLLIDEIDLHLHPGWQQQIIGLLQDAFPALQIVLSTHSPHVLSTVEKSSIRLIKLEDGIGEFEIPRFQTRGVESADVLAQIMNVNPVPQVEEAAWLSTYRSLIQTNGEETETAQGLWTSLIKHFGSEHPVINELETLQRLQTFKRVHKLS